MLPKAILFDLDDTIISFDAGCVPAWEEVCYAFSEKTGIVEYISLLDTINETRKWYWRDPERHRLGRLNLDPARFEVVRLALEKLGCGSDDDAVEITDSYLRLQEEKIHLFPSSIDTIEILKARGVKLVLITNGMSVKQRTKINKFELEKYFDFILIEEEQGFGKPDLRVFARALELLGLKAKEVWMVGDNLVWDVEAPQKLGIYSIWNDFKQQGVPTDSHIKPDRIINSITELI